jgi:type II secretory pathway component GspD/PulD (secretin)
MLVVRATLHDLDAIEAMIQALNVVPPQINIKCMFVEVSQEDAKASGIGLYLGNTMTTNAWVGGQIGTAPSFSGAPTAANPLGVFPGNPSASGNPSPTPRTLTGILTEPQFRMVLTALQQRGGPEILGQPECTMSSGRQPQMKTGDIQTVVKGINERALTAPGITTTNGDESSLYVTEQMEFGPTLDVFPSVLADGYTISLTVIPTVNAFLGYAEGRTNRVAVYANGEKKWVTPPVPNYRVFQMRTSVQVRDGQTVVLGGLVSETVNTTNKKKYLLVFITPTLIDPAGNRLHTEKEMPPGRNAVPVPPPH